jgi:integrase
MVQYVFATFRQVWNMAIRDKILSGDSPTKSVKLPKVDNKRFRYLTKKEANLLLAALQQQDLATYRMATISLYTGMRADEVFSLTWGDVDTEKEHLRIRDPKNSESRYAYITSPVKTIIDAMTHGKPSDILFPNANGEKYSDTPFAYRTVVKALKFNDGITDPLNRVCFHTLRHTFGSWLAESGAELYTIGKLLGHKTLAMTARYAHLGPNTQRAAAKLLENLQDTLHEDSNQEVAA